MDASKQLPPGFRFHPTDGELVGFLRCRALAVPLPAAVDIPVIRILAHDPSDLLPPGWSDPARYFFTVKEAKYENGRRANRTTGAGYWRNMGKQKPVVAAFGAGGPAVLMGMKRTLVFFRGRLPTGTKTDWVMHEYRLAGAGRSPWGRTAPSEEWLICRVFRQNGTLIPAATPEEEHAPGPEAEEEGVVEDEEEAGEGAAPASGFIDFFALADAAHQQQQRRVSSSCLTDE